MSLFWNHMAHAALRILNITLIAGNEMNMDVHDALPGSRAYIDANIVAIWAEFRVQQAALLGDQVHAGLDLFGRKLEKVGHMTAWDDQGVARAHRVAITCAVG